MLGVTGPIYVIRKVRSAGGAGRRHPRRHVDPDALRLQRRRLLFCEAAVALDEAFGDEREFGRKVRTLAGNYQLLARCRRCSCRY